MSATCERCGWLRLSYECFTECRDEHGRSRKETPRDELLARLQRVHELGCNPKRFIDSARADREISASTATWLDEQTASWPPVKMEGTLRK